jgi:two-component sensor histidine kinase
LSVAERKPLERLDDFAGAEQLASAGHMNIFPPLRRLLKAWLFSLLGWGTVAFAIAANGVLRRGDPWGMHLAPSLRDWLSWAIFTPLVFRLVNRLPLERGRLKIAVPVHLATMALALIATHSLHDVIGWFDVRGQTNPPTAQRDEPPPDEQFPPPPPGRGGPPPWERNGPPGDRLGPPPGLRGERPPPPDRRFGGGPWEHGGPPGPPPDRRPGPPGDPGFDLLRFLSFEAPVYLLLLTAAHAAFFFRRDQQRAASLARARLDTLRAQLHPHFLFNTLNTISGLIHENPAKADEMVVTLSELLRSSLQSSTAEEVPLQQEVEFVRRYLLLMQGRFEERLQFEIEVSAETARALVPPMLLQPLVENAVEHGLLPRPEGGLIRVEAKRDGQRLQIRVCDNGVGLGGDAPREEGIGLGHTRARLAELYGPRAAISFWQGQGLTVEITLPFHEAAAS